MELLMSGMNPKLSRINTKQSRNPTTYMVGKLRFYGTLHLHSTDKHLAILTLYNNKRNS